MAEPGEILQKQLANEIGKTITISQKIGPEISGELVEVGPNYITIKRANGRKTILVDVIGGWEIFDEVQSQSGTIAFDAAANKEVLSDSLENNSSHHDLSLLETNGFEQQIIGRLTYIEEFIAGKIRGSSIKVLPPDFTIPPDELTKTIQKGWQRIKNKYDNAVKLNELGSHFGRIQPIINDLKALIGQTRSSPSLRRYLAYFQFVSANIQEAIKNYTEVCFLTQAANDWYNVAALALYKQPPDRELAVYALEQVFRGSAITNYLNAWYCYLGLLQESEDRELLKELYNAIVQNISTSEEQYMLLASIYLLRKESIARVLVRGILREKPSQKLLEEAMSYMTGPMSDKYQQHKRSLNEMYKLFISQVMPVTQAPARPAKVVHNQPSTVQPTKVATGSKKSISLPQTLPPQLQGYITSYKKERGHGFLHGANGFDYYFHQSAIIDDDLLEQLESLTEEMLTPQKQIAVAFETPQGSIQIAVNISRQRVIDQVFELATTYADNGDYAKAVTYIKKVLSADPTYSHAQELYEKWQNYARIPTPRGSNPYARAKRLQIVEKDFEGAVKLFHQAIRQNDRFEGAVKDLAALLMQLERPKEAIHILEENRSRINDKQPIDNLLIDAYQKAGFYSQAIDLLQRNLASSTLKSKQAHQKFLIAICYLRQEDYPRAEQWFRQVLETGLNSKAAQRNLAFCAIKQLRYDEAEQLLTANLPDAQSSELLKVVEQARETGQSAQIDEMISEMHLADFSGDISPFARFFLERCTYEGVPPVHVQERRFERADVRHLEELATKLGTRRPRERAEYYLSAARILSEHDEWEDDYSQLYKYLYRSFVSRGDAAVVENKPLDSAREWYCEALSIYDGNRSRNKGDEQDAVNAVVRFLYATLNRASVPTSPVGFDNLSINENLDKLLQNPSQYKKIFDAIAYLVFRSQFAANRILTRLHAVANFQQAALDYLKSRGINVPTETVKQDTFFTLWKALQQNDLGQARTTSIELRSISRVEVTAASVEEALKRLRAVENTLIFDLDKQRVGELQKILEAMLDLSTQSAFEEQERFCHQIESRCRDLSQEIEANPTTLSVEDLYPIIETIQEKTAQYLDEILISSVPQLTLRLPRSMESYSSADNQHIDVQVVVENRIGCSPAESVELIVQEDGNFFTVETRSLKLHGSLRGGEQRISLVPLRITERALQSQAFSLPVYAQYRTRSGETLQTSGIGFPINLYSSEQFERIENPYAVYAQGGIVGDERMFYGRTELITNVAEAINQARLQSKSIIIFGQKRSGKSSILHHLEKKLKKERNLLVLNLGSVGTFLDERSPISILYQILYAILNRLEFAIEDEVDEGRSSLQLTFPSATDFYAHPTPVLYFQELLSRFQRATVKTTDWHHSRIVLLIDEFSYLYGYIKNGRLSQEFMKNWKSLLQDNLFSAVLAGQDVMPRFKEEFPNEFGVTQDERVSYLLTEDATKLIDEPIRIGGPTGESRYRERAIKRILDLTAGSPFYIQIICNRLVEYMNRKQANLVTEADVEQVKFELIEGANPLGWEHFDNLTNSGDTSPHAISEEDARTVLSKIATNSRTGPCSRASIMVETQTSVNDILEDLVAREVIEVKPGQYYAIRVGLFKEWLLAHQ